MLQNIIILILAGVALGGGAFSYWRSRTFKAELERKQEDMNRRMYELAILKELGDRIGYSLDVQKIVDVITGSLNQFIDYSAVSYMLLEPDEVIFKVDLEQSVSRKFIDEVRDRMLKSLSALLNKEFTRDQVSETLTGAIVVEDLEEPVRSFFNIPLIIGEKVVGVLTVAHTMAGLYKEEEMTILYKLIQQASHAVMSLQEVLETEQRKLNAMVESMIEGVVMTDKDYRVVVVNPAAKKIFDMDENEEFSIFDFIDRLGGRYDIRGKLEESVKLDKVLEAPEVLIGEKFFQITVSPVKTKTKSTSKAKEILGGVVIFHDITREKEVERLREDFTSMMVHELRSPLDNIKKISEVLRTPGSKTKTKDRNEYLQLVYQDSAAMLELVNGLLDIAKLESGKFEIYKAPSDIKDVVESRIRFYETSAKDADITLSFHAAKNVPEKFEFDQVRISQVLNNLISNALKFTKANGKVAIHVFMHTKGGDFNEELQGVEWKGKPLETDKINIGDSVIVTVSDTGIGIQQEHLSQIFQKFKQFRASAIQGDQKGTGLGLAIAKGIVEAHQGIIGVSSEEGKGSIFYFTLPLV